MDEGWHILTMIVSGLMIPVVGALITAFGILWRKIATTEGQHIECLERNAKMQIEMATVKAFIQSRAFLEALKQDRMRIGGAPGNFASQFQQVYVTNREREVFKDLLPSLRAWYIDGDKNVPAPCELDDDTLFFAVMRDWNETFVQTVCQSLGVSHAACCLYAMCLLRESTEHDAHGKPRQD